MAIDLNANLKTVIVFAAIILFVLLASVMSTVTGYIIAAIAIFVGAYLLYTVLTGVHLRTRKFFSGGRK